MTSIRLPRAAPAAKNVDPAGILAFLDEIRDGGLELHSFLLFRAGAVVAEGFWQPYGPDRVHMQHSATKSWTATAIGLAIGEGLLTLEDKVVGFFPDQLPAEVGANLAAMTVRDLLTMRTGHRSGISGGEWRQMKDSWVAAFLREPVDEAPGQTFIYSSASSYMLSAIVTRVTGQTVRDYLEPRLFRPLGIGPVRWDVSPEGLSTGGNGLSCTTEDVAKFGVLHLQGGMWEGRQILPAEWVREATRNQVDEVWMAALDGKRFRPRDPSERSATERREGYGYQWWMAPHGGYRASGLYGQQCVVLPEQDAVIVFTAAIRNGDRRLFPAVWTHLFPALGAVGPDADRVQPVLAGRLAALALPEIEGAAQSPMAATVDGRRFRFEPNEDGVSGISLAFSADRCVFTLSDHRGTHRIAAGLGHRVEGDTTMTGNLLHHEYQPDVLRVVARGVWLDERRFVMTWRFVETAFCDTVTVTFGDGDVRLDRRVNTNAGPLERPTLLGRAV
ncbi:MULTISPECIES: serine hydrolase domain-containing protein [Inquilinus]|uniref:CubicO group peptidase (Beta-lactamase class C family) n=1 Tax=Inquilinus ginsengisoli TaxID=363840 RepID=A0ABU1K0A5_9PROT|nr:serine hydrolase [Inquilinus ginsengisoli]MDR6293250.1 CubicO group peptidase (beta-lactamase class C family) [Inquilinus ginsengisoli]